MNEIKRILKALGHSCSGARYCLKEEAAFRSECVIIALSIPVLVMVDFTLTEKVIVMISSGLVLLAEAGNTAIEAVVDRVSLDWHERSKKAKDVGSFMVGIAMILYVMVWGILVVSHYG